MAMSTSESSLQLAMPFAPEAKPEKKKRARSPVPRFKASRTHQLNAVEGCPSLMVPPDHMAHRIQRAVEKLDTSALEAQYSSLGRHGFHPKAVLAVWVYASSVGMHHASKAARALKTDAAFRLLSGGNVISPETLRRFRRNFKAVFPALMEQLLKAAVESGMVQADDLALDSVRIEADASMKQVRTLERSEKRLVEMEKVDKDKLDEAQRARFEEQFKKHQEAVAACTEKGLTNFVKTCPSASLLKFPHGAARPGHRVSAVVSGTRSRFIVALLIDAASCDYGKVKPLMEAARKALTKAGIGESVLLRATADAGYFCADDLAYTAAERAKHDVLINEPAPPLPKKEGHAKELKYFGRDTFKVDLEELTAVCPAGTPMEGPHRDEDGITKWYGVGCSACALKEKCTSAKEKRKLTVRVEYEKNREEMRQRMAQPGAKVQYNTRIATVEPAFSYIEDVMSFRRASSRKTDTVEGEIMLKVFAYNLLRLIFCARSFVVLLEVLEEEDEVGLRFWGGKTLPEA